MWFTRIREAGLLPVPGQFQSSLMHSAAQTTHHRKGSNTTTDVERNKLRSRFSPKRKTRKPFQPVFHESKDIPVVSLEPSRVIHPLSRPRHVFFRPFPSSLLPLEVTLIRLGHLMGFRYWRTRVSRLEVEFSGTAAGVRSCS